MKDSQKSVNRAFVFVFLFIGIVFAYIGLNFTLKTAKIWRYSIKKEVKGIEFFVKKGARGFYILSEYHIDDLKKQSEPLMFGGRPRLFEDREWAQMALDQYKRLSWPAYTTRDGQVTINEPPHAIKEGVYLLVCLALFIYFLVLRKKVLTMLDTSS